MQKLIQIENIKTFSSNTFRVILTLHFVFYILVILAVSRIELSLGQFSISRLYDFPNVWEFFSWVASWFNILLGVLVIVLICNEFRFYTFRQQIMNGLNEGHLLLGKIYMMVVIAVYALILVIISSFVSGNLTGSESLGLSQFSGMEMVLVYFLQTLAYMSMAMLFAMIFKNNGLAIVTFILYLFPAEVILRSLLFRNVQEYFPAKLISGLTPLPSIFRDQASSLKGIGMDFNTTQTTDLAFVTPEEIGLTVLYIAVFLAIAYWILKRKSY